MTRALSTPPGAAPLLAALRDPNAVAGFSRRDWADLIRLGRRANVLGQLAYRFQDQGIVTPDGPWQRLEAYRIRADFIGRSLLWETRLVANVLRPIASPLVLMKGVAYLALDLPFARGRLAADIDMMVPRGQMAAVEAALLAKGWEGEALSAYDTHYYRDWMHEIPALHHKEREIELDLHHTLAPPVSRVKADGAALSAAALPLPPDRLGAGLAVLAEEDRILHSAIHLFAGGELNGSIRELMDIDGLFRLVNDPGLWPSLIDRAARFQALPPLYWAARYCVDMLGTPLPDAFRADLARHAPTAPVRALMDALVRRTLLPEHPDARRVSATVARRALYIRSHWIKMPPAMLAGHLARKAWMRFHGNA